MNLIIILEISVLHKNPKKIREKNMPKFGPNDVIYLNLTSIKEAQSPSQLLFQETYLKKQGYMGGGLLSKE